MAEIQNWIDAEFEPLAEDVQGPKMGLVVGYRKTKAEFEAMATELNIMSKGRTMPAIEFVNEADEIETGAPGRSIEL